MLGSTRLRRSQARWVTAKLSAAAPLKALGFRLSEWVRFGAGAPGGDTRALTMVEVTIAGYFAQAVDHGRRWGVAAGLLLGIGGALAIAVLTVLIVKVAG